MSERFFRSNRPGYPHPVSSELENSGIRVAVGDCSVTERRRWRPPYQNRQTVHVHATHYIHDEDGRTAPGVCGNGSVPLSHSGNVVTRIGIHTHFPLFGVTQNIYRSHMKFYFNMYKVGFAFPKHPKKSRSIFQDGSRFFGCFGKEKLILTNKLSGCWYFLHFRKLVMQEKLETRFSVTLNWLLSRL